MMLGIKLAAFNSLNANQKQVAQWIAARLQFGDPARYTAGAVTWLVFDDDRFGLEDVALLATVAANFAQWANATLQPPGDGLRQQIRTWAAGKVVWPAQIDYSASTDPIATTLAANGAPASITAADRVPDSWVPL